MKIKEECFTCKIPVKYCTGDPKTCKKTYARAKQKQLDKIVNGAPTVPRPAVAHEKMPQSKYNKNRYHRLKNAGICVNCGRKPAAQGYVLCPECHAKHKEYNRVYLIKNKDKAHATKHNSARSRYRYFVDNGICPRCRKHYAQPGYVLCEECRVKQKAYTEMRKNKKLKE